MQKKLFAAILCAAEAVSALFAGGGQDNVSAGGTPTLKWVTVGSGMPKNYNAWVQKVNAYI